MSNSNLNNNNSNITSESIVSKFSNLTSPSYNYENSTAPLTPSMQEFRETSVNTTSKALIQELNNLVNSAPKTLQSAFRKEMDDFYRLYMRYAVEKAKGFKLDWNKISTVKDEQIQSFGELNIVKCDKSMLDKLAVLKLNGGLGTTMGCVGPKSAIEVRDNMSFLDLSVRQIEHLNQQYGTDVPLLLMNSFNTMEQTFKMIQKYADHKITIMNFNQSRYPRIKKDTSMPLPTSYDSHISQWYPPGHGDLYDSLFNSGLLDKLLEEGKEYLFVSNIDNLGATVDPTILKYAFDNKIEFLMEVTNKTKADVKGGTLINYDNNIRLLEIAQVPSSHVEDFKSIKKFKIFNTNNLWISLKAIKRLVVSKSMSLEIIVNNKTTAEGEAVIQLETAVGAAIKHFNNAKGINVPRDRFLPVKSTSDLFLITSDLYSMKHGVLNMNPKRVFKNAPVIKLGDHFKKVNDFLRRFRSPPHILELDHLTISGDGTVIMVANHGSRIDIPDGAVLEDKVVSGNLRIMDH